jgi:Fur family zinc uptake transcriptional regulator
VLEILCASPVPLSAYDILGRVQSEIRIAPTQVYRILDSLQESGLIHKLATRPAFMLRSSKADNAKGVVFMVCNHCGGVQEAPSDLVLRGLTRAAKANSFKPINPIIEIEGECARCVSDPLR